MATPITFEQVRDFICEQWRVSPERLSPGSRLLHDLGIERTVARYDVINSWPDIVGEKIAKVTVPERIDRGILFVSVATAAWRTELTLSRLAILKKITARVGSGAVKDIRFR